MAQVKVTIDGREVLADSALTILEVAQSLGIAIPTLCHDPRLAPFSSCFVCVVEVAGARGYVPSCATKVTDQMVVKTDTPELRQARKTALELIVSNHFADCLGPCQLTCPASVDIQGYIALVAMGRYSEAVALIKETNPFPSVCGRICTRPCEGKCRRNLTDEPVGVDYLKRYAADLDRAGHHPFTPPRKPPTGRRIAVVGGGPAGMTAAYYLALEGHRVVVFESQPKAGGWLRYGIPEYRLPEDVLDYEIESILQLGVELENGKRLGRDFQLETLFDQGYEAVFLGVGAWRSTLMNIPGEDAQGVLSGIGFLEKANNGEIDSISGRVVVVGGGNTAVDAARTSLRLGADSVTLVYRRSRSEMPAHHLEIEEMEHEGVRLELLANPTHIHQNDQGRITRMTCIRMQLGEPDASGRRRPVPIEGSEFDIETDWILEAIGQQAETDYIESSRMLKEIKTTRWGTLEVDPEAMTTSVPGIFAGGDMITGPATAIEAIAAGKKAAGAIHHFLTGHVIPRLQKPFLSKKENLKPELVAEDLYVKSRTPRQVIPSMPVEERIKGFLEVELGYTPDQAAEEVQRCLECGCNAFFECDLQRHCTDWQVTQRAFSGEFQHQMPDEHHPFLRLDLNKCILCGRCIRICDEVVGAAALGFVKRGFDAKIQPALEKPLLETSCISCGQCADTCPTGAITVQPDAPKPGPFKLPQVESVCNYCGVGCGILLEAVEGRVVRVLSNRAAPVNDGGNLCRSGRFGFRAINSPDRLVRPLIRRDNRLVEATWDEAYAVIRDRLAAVLSAHGSRALSVMAGARLTNEEAYLIQKLSRSVWRTANVYEAGVTPHAGAAELAASQPTIDFERLTRADAIVVLGVNPLQKYPILDFKLQRIAQSGRCRVFYLHPDKTFLAGRAHRWIPLPVDRAAVCARALLAEAFSRLGVPGNQPALAALDQELAVPPAESDLQQAGMADADIRAILDLLLAKRPVIVFDPEEISADANAHIHNLAVLLNSHGFRLALLPMMSRSNSRGVLEMGCHPAFLPGWQPAESLPARERIQQVWKCGLPAEPGLDHRQLSAALKSGGIRAALVFGADPAGGAASTQAQALFQGLDFLMVQDLFLTPTAESADVVLPAASFAETSGTVINAERRVQRIHAAMAPLSGKSGIQILQDLARLWGADFGSADPVALWDEMQAATPTFKGVSLSQLDTRGAVLAQIQTDGRLFVSDPGLPPWPESFPNGIDAMVRRWQNRLCELGIVRD